MRPIITHVVPSHKCYYQPQKTEKNFIADNIKNIKTNRNDNFPHHEAINKKEYKFNVDIPYLSPKNRKITTTAENKKSIPPINRTRLEDIKTIDYFVIKLKEKNISCIKNLHQTDINVAIQEVITALNLKKNQYLGHGSYGVAYRLGNFVIKMPTNRAHLETHFAKLGRSRRILTEINQDHDFARVLTLNNGLQVLVSKFIDGKSITGKEAYDFVKNRGRILHDFDVTGNVKKDRHGKLYLIDPDFVSLPKRTRRNSLGSEQLYTDYPSFTRNHLKFNNDNQLK